MLEAGFIPDCCKAMSARRRQVLESQEAAFVPD